MLLPVRRPGGQRRRARWLFGGSQAVGFLLVRPVLLVEAFQASPGHCAGLLRTPLDAAKPKQGVAVTGSPCDAFSGEPWVVRLRQLLAAAVRRGQRVLGMCFGCQVVAVALQGSAGE